jgi:hypothetical protein
MSRSIHFGFLILDLGLIPEEPDLDQADSDAAETERKEQ